MNEFTARAYDEDGRLVMSAQTSFTTEDQQRAPRSVQRSRSLTDDGRHTGRFDQ
ncbi:hypothetical protein [Methylobacterium sp. PvR107]|uniref:hypothetical protein n=1 Tax=Methylobacterium sp. PvR107 TaxID=2806597 RepID=UPI001AE72999|nr:hypothetical protein [Methylobacterium sp. PvR107]MBP1179930.1 lactam utilization protein B [Methylobacterium sp. PvR107]